MAWPTAKPQTVLRSPGTNVKLVVKEEQITSQALAGNLLGDPATRPLFVALPSDYATSDRRYPVVYVLHGYMQDAYSHVTDAVGEMETALHRGEVQEMILVFPDASNLLKGSMYLSSPAIGDYETYLTKEVVDFVDANYRTIPHRESRGVTGCSMGGDGAIHLALKYPGVYSVAAPMSGTYDWEHDPWLDPGARGFTREPNRLSELLTFATETLAEMALAAAAAPNLANPPFYFDMPYQLVDGTGEVVPSVWQQVSEKDPMHDAERYVEQQVRLTGILLHHGTGDDLVPVDLARSFERLLANLGIEHQYLEVPAGHCPNWTPSLMFMSEHLVLDDPGQ